MFENTREAMNFTHRLSISKPEGFGPESVSSLDEYVLAQIARRWNGSFARVGQGEYLICADETAASGADSLSVLLAVSLCGRFSTPILRVAPLDDTDESPALSAVALDAETKERLRAKLAVFNGRISNLEAAERTEAADLQAIAHSLGTITGQVETLGGDLRSISGQIGEGGAASPRRPAATPCPRRKSPCSGSPRAGPSRLRRR